MLHCVLQGLGITSVGGFPGNGTPLLTAGASLSRFWSVSLWGWILRLTLPSLATGNLVQIRRLNSITSPDQ